MSPLSVLPPPDLRARMRMRIDGKVSRVVGLLVEGTCPGAAVGDLVDICLTAGSVVTAEVVGLRDGHVLLVALGDVRGVHNGARLVHQGVAAEVACSDAMLGRVIDARGRPMDDGLGPIPGPFTPRPLYAPPPSPMSRALIDKPLHVGVRVIDGLLTLGLGQRMGIFAGAGVGKSHLLGALARSARSDVNVIALIGERGREVGEFLEKVLSPEARRKTITVVATSDRSPLERVRGAYVAHTIAEHFAEPGRNVLLMMDSLTRFAMGQRELGLSVGEPPATRGYTPSVFAALPRLLERAGRFSGRGSITGLYTVLVEGDDMSDPVADSARSILDGHIVLSRELASRGHYPAVDALASVSRVAPSVLQPAHLGIGRAFREILANLREGEELVSIGAHVEGAAPRVDRALAARDNITTFLRQGEEVSPFPQTLQMMAQIIQEVQ